MKKLLALLFAMVMLCSVASAADSFTFDPANAPYTGAWVDIGIGYQAYLPAEWYIMEVNDEMAAAGLVSLYQSPDFASAFAVSKHIATGSDGRIITDYDTLFIEYTAAGIEVYHLTINGMPVVGYDADDIGESGLFILDGTGTIYTLGFAPNSQAEVGMTILTSVQPLPAK